jgi:hypothetical protein
VEYLAGRSNDRDASLTECRMNRAIQRRRSEISCKGSQKYERNHCIVKAIVWFQLYSLLINLIDFHMGCEMGG